MVIGLGALFSGAALVSHIVARISLLLAVVLTTTMFALAMGITWRRSSHDERVSLARLTRVGLGSGLLATLAYDISRFVLSRADASPYDPFEAMRMFGLALVGSGVSENAALVAGTAFHTVNGISFGVAYCFLFGERGAIVGIAWGLSLELFQLILYPGWLDIRFYREFAQVSALSHLAYGAVLGIASQRGLRGTVG